MQNMEKEIRENGGLIRSKDRVNENGEFDGDTIRSIGDAIPREPEKIKLRGHRARITKIMFHPIYTLLATSSEDASIKIWDFETGECE